MHTTYVMIFMRRKRLCLTRDKNITSTRGWENLGNEQGKWYLVNVDKQPRNPKLFSREYQAYIEENLTWTTHHDIRW